MSYRGYKRLLGETSLERKSLFFFGIVILVLILVTVYATRNLKHQYAQPVIVPGGIPVDIDAISRRQHEAAMGPSAPTPPQIVQIAGIEPPPQPGERASHPENRPE